jgi:hypothetical protein
MKFLAQRTQPRTRKQVPVIAMMDLPKMTVMLALQMEEKSTIMKVAKVGIMKRALALRAHCRLIALFILLLML